MGRKSRLDLPGLDPDRLALLELLLAEEGLGPEPGAAIGRRPEGEAPLSFEQERLWFLDRLNPGSPFYNLPAAFLLTGALDATALVGAVRAVLERHDSLRTCFPSRDGRPVAVVSAELPAPTWVDLRHLPAGERAAEANRLAAVEARRPFDLERGPLVRVTVLRLLDDEHVVIVNFHHACADGWSIPIFLCDLGDCYAAFARGGQPGLAPLPIQYADYAWWQRRRLGGGALERQLGYWKTRLGDRPAALELPTDRPRPPVQSYRGATEPLEFDRALVRALVAHGRREGVTLFMTLAAGFAALLGRWCGQRDVVIGTPVAGRQRLELEPLIGFFVNTLVLRTTLAPDLGFRQLLAQVRASAIAAFTHQEVPFAQVVEHLRPERDLSRTPLVQVVLSVHRARERGREARFPGLELGPWPGATARPEPTVSLIDTGTSKFDLFLSLVETRGALTGWFEYNTDLFEPGTVRRFGEHLQALLAAALADPGAPLGALPLMGEAERRRVTVGWNRTAVARGADETVSALLAAAARRDPERVAVVGPDRQLTYGELAARSEALGAELRARGVGPEVLVGVCVERSPDMLVALLGTLAAGGAYVPLDPAHPAARLDYILADSGVRVLVADRANLGRFAGRVPALVQVDAERSPAPSPPSATRSAATTAGNSAYVIYTSGSTGQPKGVVVTHGALLNFLAAMRRMPGLERDDVLLAVTTLAFDIAALELFLPLSVGATVVIADRAAAGDATGLASLLSTSGATAMQATPATWRMLLDAGWTGAPQLKALCGGEALPRDLADRLHARVAELWNLYGPTETTVWSLLDRVESGPHHVPIGRPIANTRVYLLDAALEPVPIGVRGEIYIAGDGLARGYLARPDLTASRFVPDPFAAEAGARMYRTGDLARYREDGKIVFLGRVDHQMKLRGHRIEPGEIEVALGAHPDVGAAVVVMRERAPGDQRLIAYAVARSGRALPPVDEIRRFVAANLPDYMVPSAVVALAALPLTPNGKLDRAALPEPSSERPDVARFQPPQSELERTIAAVWREVLGVDRVGADDNFFDLGGHSLLLTAVHARLLASCDSALRVTDLFRFPTVRSLAHHLAGGDRAAAADEGRGRADLRLTARRRRRR